ncbi:hypothetical protein H7Y63_02765, partial [Polaromonas sp.]|nr:hypothetical protein [Candidatus Saccharibacteria bacterium]
ALWGDATRNQALARTGKWLLANEANTAQKAWRIGDTSDAALANYTSPVASLNFSGKRTYTTFFSDEASAKLGIQLIPMDPSMAGFKQDKDTITKSVLSTIKNDNYNVPLGDYVLMYSSLNNPEAALASASKQTSIDDGNSKTYMLAWIYAQQTP